MPGWFSDISAFTIFLGIGALGFLFLLVSLVFGEVFEHFGDFDHDRRQNCTEPSSPKTRALSAPAF